MKTIQITKGKSTTVDDDMFEEFSKYKWQNTKGYATRAVKNGERKITWRMHWSVIGKPNKGFVVDHINGNKLDNRRENLRIVNTTQNNLNRSTLSKNNKSGLLGVSYKKSHKSWVAQLQMNGKSILQKHFKNKEDAQKCYLQAKQKYTEVDISSR
jgi:hypothetical protein